MRMDLHVHTLFSDGDLSPNQAVKKAVEAGLFAIALTDHDECRGFGALQQTDDIRVYAGIELSAQHSGEVHVLGIGIDWCNAKIHEHIEKASGARRVRISAMIDRLFRAGIVLEMADVEAQCRGSVIGRPHVAAALVKKGYAQTRRDAFERFLSTKTPFYVPQQRISLEQAASLIKQAGGLPVLAHPGLLSTGLLSTIEPHLADMGFWGIEAYHPAHTDGQCVIFESMARRLGLYVTSGSDYHGRLTPVQIGGETRGGEWLAKSFAVLNEYKFNIS